MRLIGRILGVLLAVTVALVIGAVLWLQDANRLKPELAALIEENSGYATRIDGDVRWQLFPPLHLELNDLHLQRADEDIHAGRIDLKMDLSAMWQDIDQWRISQLHLTDTTLVQDEATTNIAHLDVIDFRPGEPADFDLAASYLADPQAEPVAAEATGTFTYHPATDTDPERLTLKDTQFVTDVATGTCAADVTTRLMPPMSVPPAADDALLPVETLLSYDVGADCTLSELTVGTETFHQARFEITNVDGLLNVLVDIKDFLGGSMLTDVDVDLTQQVPSWTVLPEIANVDSERLIDWTDQRLQWIAPLAFSSSIKMQGNTEAELAQSIQAQSEFDGGQGQLNIAKIKQQLARIALFTQKADEVAHWPDLWNYESFTGRWLIDGPAHDLKFALDNMSVNAQGDYDYAADTIDFLAQVTISEAPAASPFKINEMLQDTPIPVRCRGPAADPECRLDQDATQNLVAQALRSDSDSGLRRKLEDKIDEKVPEEYRETARSLLDLLGRSLERD